LSNGRRRWPWLLAACLLALVVYTAVMFQRIRRQMWADEARPADVIVVLGAAEYAGRPSPVFRARLDHALNLYHRGIAPMMITTGGKGEDPQFSEGGVGRKYLIEHGVPDEAIIAETQSDNTDEATERVATIMQKNGMKSCVVVSDGYHLYRAKQMLGRYGLQAYGAPRPQPRPQSRWQRATLVLREVLSYTLWRLHIT
jgi:uncharacterized SAM-binding protein YcdF (DUF218 family)